MPIRNHVQVVKNSISILLTENRMKKPCFLLKRKKKVGNLLNINMFY